MGLAGVDMVPPMMGGMMPMAGVNAPMSGAATTSVADSAPEEESAPAKEFFDLKLVGFESASKIKVIKEVRALSGLGLKEVSCCSIFIVFMGVSIITSVVYDC